MFGDTGGWNANNWTSAAKSSSGNSVPNIALSCGIPLTQNMAQVFDAIHISLSIRVPYNKPTGNELHVKLFKWTCGTFTGGSTMTLVPITNDTVITLTAQSTIFWWACYDSAMPLISDFNFNTDRLFIGFAGDNDGVDIIEQGGQISYKLWGELIPL